MKAFLSYQFDLIYASIKMCQSALKHVLVLYNIHVVDKYNNK